MREHWGDIMASGKLLKQSIWIDGDLTDYKEAIGHVA